MTSKADIRRFQKLQEHGCAACHMLGHPGVPGDVHHLVDKGSRKQSGGDRSSFILCPYHHRGVFGDILSPSQVRLMLGPSLRNQSKAFHAKFGTQRELLARVNAALDGKVPLQRSVTDSIEFDPNY